MQNDVMSVWVCPTCKYLKSTSILLRERERKRESEGEIKKTESKKERKTAVSSFDVAQCLAVWLVGDCYDWWDFGGDEMGCCDCSVFGAWYHVVFCFFLLFHRYFKLQPSYLQGRY